jgi:hypothetical protein
MTVCSRVALVVCAATALCGCGAGGASFGRAGTAEFVAETPSSAGPFTPASYVARPTVGIGSKYANLLSPDSYVIWFSDEVAELKAELEAAEGAPSDGSKELLRIAKTLNEKYLILECHIVSTFPDSSVGYDITSFRHADVFLLDDSGMKFEPLQMIIGSLEKGNKDALMQFSRVNLVVFPKYDLLTGDLVIDSRARDVSLVISGYKTTYFFSWGNLSPAPQRPGGLQPVEMVGGMGLQHFEPALRWLAENFK